MARMRFTGEVPVLFNDLYRGPVEPGEEFDVPDAERERYSRRGDVEDLDAPEPETEAEPAGDAPVVEAPSEAAPTADTTGAPAQPAPPTE